MTNEDQISKQIREFILSRFPLARQREIALEDDLLDSGIVDSLGVLEIVSFLEAEFPIALADEDIVDDHFQSIAQLVEFVQQKLPATVQSMTADG